MKIPDFRLAFRALDEGLIDRADLVRLINVLENWHRGDLRVSCAELLSREFRLDPNRVRRWETELAGQPSSRIGPYRLQRRVGQGGMGVVFEADHPNLERTVALKILTPGRKDPAAIQRFLREVKSAGQFNHPNIVHAYDAGIDGDIPYLAMEFVSGENLFQYLLREGPLSVERAVDWLTQATSALWFLESLGWTHGDGKPSNWIVTPRGTLKLVDLGLCRPPGRLRDPELIHGSPPYIAPEQLGTGERIDIRSDLYALGATFYHLLAGRPPYAARTVLDLVKAQRSERIVPVAVARPDLPAELASLIDRLLENNPADRFAGCAELADAISALPGSPRVLSPSVHRSPETARKPALHPVVVGLLAVGAASCVLAGAYFARVWWSPPETVRDDPTTVTSSRPELESSAPRVIEPELEWERLWQQEERSWSEIFSWLDTREESPEILAWKSEAEQAFEAEASIAWRAVEAEVTEQRAKPDFSSALERLDRFPVRLRLGAYALGHRRLRVGLREERAKQAEAHLASLRAAFDQGDPVAARAILRGVGEAAPWDRAFYLSAIREAFPLSGWWSQADASLREERVATVSRREQLWNAMQGGDLAAVDWSEVGSDPGLEWVRALVASHPELFDPSLGDTLLARLSSTRLLARANLEALTLLSDVLGQVIPELPREAEAARALDAADSACAQWRWRDAELHWARLELDQFSRTAAVAEYRRRQPDLRRSLLRGAFLRSEHFSAQVEGGWGETPTLSYRFASGETLREWRHASSIWQAESGGLVHRTESRELLETWIPFEGPIEIDLQLVPPGQSWETMIGYGELAVGLQYLSVGELRVIAGTSASVAANLERPSGQLLIDTLILSQQTRLTVAFLDGKIDLGWGDRRVTLAVESRPVPGGGELGGFLSWRVPGGMRLRQARIRGRPADVWLDARAEIVGFP